MTDQFAKFGMTVTQSLSSEASERRKWEAEQQALAVVYKKMWPIVTEYHQKLRKNGVGAELIGKSGEGTFELRIQMKQTIGVIHVQNDSLQVYIEGDRRYVVGYAYDNYTYLTRAPKLPEGWSDPTFRTFLDQALELFRARYTFGPKSPGTW